VRSCLILGIVLACVAHAQEPPGAELFRKRCGGCHAMDRDKAGPNLKGVYGRRAASGESFPYSDALRKSGITWNAATLESWLADPEKLVPGNDMPFHVESSAERALIIAYLKQSSADQRTVRGPEAPSQSGVARAPAAPRSQSIVTVTSSVNAVR